MNRIDKIASRMVATSDGSVGSRVIFIRDIHTKGGTEFRLYEEAKITEYTKEHPYRVVVTGDGGKMIKLPVELAWKVLKDFPKPPSLHKMRIWSEDGVARSVDGQVVEPDGVTHDNVPSWLLVVGVI